MKVRKLQSSDSADLRRLKTEVLEAEVALNRAISLLPEKQKLAEARGAFREKCSEVAGEEMLSDDFEYAVVLDKEKK